MDDKNPQGQNNTDDAATPVENHGGAPIATLGEWKRLAPPASPHHWREYRSAFELAQAWIEGDAAQQLRELLATRAQFAGAVLERAIAEYKTWFDDIPGGPRNHDLLVVASTNVGRVVVGIEGKADETFDRDLMGFCAAALRRQASTRAPERLDRVTRALLGTTLAEDPKLGSLRYKLLSALAGTLVEARRFNAAAAVLLVHEFSTPETDPRKQRQNASDLESFVARLGAAPRTTSDQGAWLAGPFAVPGNTHLPADIPVYVGKLSTRIERRTPIRPDPSPRQVDPMPSPLPAPTCPD